MNSSIHRHSVLAITLFCCSLIIGCSARVSNEKIMVYMIGDSTMADKPLEDNPERGWGQLFPRFFDDAVVIENHAKNGRSTRSFIAENLWQPVVDKLKKGDYVFIQFGHNDESKEKTDRYTPPEDYRKYLIKFLTEAEAKDAQPILCTPIVRRHFDSTGTFSDTHGVYPQIVRDVAAEYKVPLIDMDTKSAALVTALGPDSTKKIYEWIEPGVYKSIPKGKQDNTHFTEYGAITMAQLAVDGIHELHLGLEKHLKK